MHSLLGNKVERTGPLPVAFDLRDRGRDTEEAYQMMSLGCGA